MSAPLPAQEEQDVRLLDGFELSFPQLPDLPFQNPLKSHSVARLEGPLSSRSSATDGSDVRAMEQEEDEAPTKPKRTFKRSKTAEEKAARIKARNRRAQQAFRSRQKALNVERAQSLDNLQKEVTYLRQVNGQLVRKVEELACELAELKFPSQQGLPDFESMLKQEASDVSEDLQSMCPLVLGMIPNDSLGL